MEKKNGEEKRSLADTQYRFSDRLHVTPGSPEGLVIAPTLPSCICVQLPACPQLLFLVLRFLGLLAALDHLPVYARIFI